jgi:hypothetical protein
MENAFKWDNKLKWRNPKFFRGWGLLGVTPGILFGEFQQIQLRTEGRENRDLGAVAP